MLHRDPDRSEELLNIVSASLTASNSIVDVLSPRPVLPTQLTSSTLRCSQFQTNVFCLRERDLLERFTSEVAQLQGRGESREFSFLLSHQLAEDLGKAFTEKAILQTILDAEAKLPTGSVKGSRMVLQASMSYD
ncbi:hypothetical protein AXX17_AT3G06560 [Arabidopsis thaliana]|uniref:Uncharacterized protein n=1 Tax=Arabidopsis thaliana TaxID=3702 RepID=A0A178VK76_ARATH|nr:hypothetical protein AXX17_AT3G06560 [Arabidopsis thaliana]